MSTEGGWAIPPHSWRRRQHYFVSTASGNRSLCEKWWLTPNPGRLMLAELWRDDDYCRACERRQAQLETKEGE